MALPGLLHGPANSHSQILEEENSHVRTLILNRPEKLNALSLWMVDRLRKKFEAYEKDPNVKLVILKARGKAFCAGGDVAALTQYMVDGHWSFGTNYYKYILKMIFVIATNQKPRVSLINGIVMGTGAGASIQCLFRVVTENAVFAMPETSLGLSPDVGSTHFLSRLPGYFGEYLGLTGARLNAAELLACGLATHFVFSKSLSALEEALKKVKSSDPATISGIIDEFALRPVVKQNSVCRRLDIIDKCFSKATVEEIISALEDEAENRADESNDWIVKAIKSLKMASPLALKVFLRSVREGRTDDLRRCLIRENRISCHTGLRTVSHDFHEGCRAILVEKDGKPKWYPPKLELVTTKMVDKFFNKVDDDDWEDLQLSARATTLAQIQPRL